MTGSSAIAAVLFDLDGVVADTQQAVTAFWQEMAAAHGITLSPEDFQRTIYGVPASQTLDALFPRLSWRERGRLLEQMYAREAAGPYREIPGALRLLLTLREHGVPTALVTSAEPLKVGAVLDALGLQGLFDATVTRDDITRGKPDPESYLLAASRLGAAPDKCVVLEDALSGVEAAIAAGCICIGVNRPELAAALLAAGAAAVVPDLRNITLDSSNGYRVLTVAAGRVPGHGVT